MNNPAKFPPNSRFNPAAGLLPSIGFILMLLLSSCTTRQPAGGQETVPVTVTTTRSVPAVVTQETAREATPSLTVPSATATKEIILSNPAILVTPFPLPPENTPVPGGIEKIQKIYELTEPALIESKPSPDGKWRADVLRYDCTKVSEDSVFALEILHLVSTAGGDESTLELQLQNCGGLGAIGLGDLTWSGNSRFLYYTPATKGAPDGGCAPWYRPWIRYDTSRNLKQSLGSGLFSPDLKWFAALALDSVQVWDLNMDEGMSFSYTPMGVGYRALAWSPDSSRLGFLINGTEGCALAGGIPSQVFVIDPRQSSSKMILESTTPSFGGISWNEMEVMRLDDENRKPWQFTLANGELQQIP